MSRHFTATLLLERPWPLDIDAVAASMRERFPQIGQVEAAYGQVDGRDSGVITIDGGTLVVQSLDEPVTMADLTPPLRTLRTVNVDDAAQTHQAHLTVTCGGSLPGLDGAKAYAAATHFTAAAAIPLTPVSAVFWQRGWALSQPDTFRDSAQMLLEARMPLGAWVSFATIVPRGFAPEDATGMVTYGLKPFIGRELELAPRPGEAKSAFQCVSGIARMVLDRGHTLADGQRLEDADGTYALTVRERTFWLRRDLSAYVLVADTSIVDRDTLKAEPSPAA